MSLKSKIESDYQNSLKSKDKGKISTYRLILASIKDLDIANRSGPKKKETDDNDVLSPPAKGLPGPFRSRSRQYLEASHELPGDRHRTWRRADIRTNP